MTIEEQMTEFRKKVIQLKKRDKDESILSPIWIIETNTNDNVTPGDNEDYPWPKGTICIAGDSVVSGLQPGLLSQKHKVKVKSFSGTNVRGLCTTI